MTTVGWLSDKAEAIGGAELTQQELRAAAPERVEVVPCPAGEPLPACDLYVVHNCVQYELAELEPLSDEYVVKYWHDIGPHLQPGVRAWLDEQAIPVCCSPLQAEAMGLSGDASLIPPPIDLQRFERAAAQRNGNRKGRVCIGSWRNFGKAPHRAAEWGAANGGVKFYGGGVFAPPGSVGAPQEEMPDLLASYETFVYLPAVLEPFGRVVAEAWASGCELVVNDLVGAKWWITERPAALGDGREGLLAGCPFVMRPRIAIIVPTIPGREKDFARCCAAYGDTAAGARIYAEFDHLSCGEAWIAGAEGAERDGFDYLHLTSDDLEPHPGWLEAAIETVDAGEIPAPLVYHPDGALESAGLQGFGCYLGPHHDGMPCEGTTVPFLSRAMWERIGMIPVHYCSDLWVSYKGRLEGWETVLRTGMRFTHHTAQAGRNYGRVSDDTSEYLRRIEAL